MPNIKSAKKRVIVNNKKTEQNKAIRSAVKTKIKKVDILIKDGKFDEAKIALNDAFKALDSAASKNIIHQNNAANKKAKLSKKLFVAENSGNKKSTKTAKTTKKTEVKETVETETKE